MTETIALSARRLWSAYPRETLVLGGLGVAAALALGGAAYSNPSLGALGRGELDAPVAAAVPAPPPLIVRKLAPQDALSINQQIPLRDGPNPAARPFAFRGDSAARARALDCLASAVYYEAAQESADGQRAVAQVVLNRVRHAAFPSTVCGVVYQGSTRVTGCQFTFTCDGSLARRPGGEQWARARAIANAALSGAVHAPVGYATHYHANYVVPYWASSLAKNAVIGAHIFYRWSGGWGRPAAFVKSHSGAEPDSGLLRTAALAAEATQPAVVATAEVAEAVAEIPGAEAKPAEAGRVGMRFNLAAREAVEKAIRERSTDKTAGSDNLRWSLTGAMASANEKPLGKPIQTAQGGASPAAAPQP